jgi:hypothetical protein
MKKIICFFTGHKKGPKIQTKGEYVVYICERCGEVFAKKG